MKTKIFSYDVVEDNTVTELRLPTAVICYIKGMAHKLEEHSREEYKAFLESIKQKSDDEQYNDHGASEMRTKRGKKALKLAKGDLKKAMKILRDMPYNYEEAKPDAVGDED